MSTLCTPNAYTTICTSTIYSMVSGLETLKLPVYQDIILDDYSQTASLFTIFPIRWAAASYMLVQSSTNDTLKFWSVNMSEHNVLTANYNTFNVIPALIVNYRGIIVLKYKDKSFQFKFSVPFLDQLVGTKAKIQNMFNEKIKTYVLFDRIVFCFIKVEGDVYYRFVYAGILDMINDKLTVQNTTHFDYNNGTLVGLLDKKPYMLYSRYGLETVNLYPYTNYVTGLSQLAANQLVVGGLNNYFLEPEDVSKPNQWKVNYSFELQYQAPYYLSDPAWGYTPLRVQIPIPNTCNFVPPNSGPTFIMAFNNLLLPTLVYLGTTQFSNTDNTIITFPLQIFYTNDPTAEPWYVYPEGGLLPPPETPNGYLYYYLSQTEMTIYQPTFESFLTANTGAISIEDLKFNHQKFGIH